jgi:large subunit ribosomal protein L17
MFRNMVTSLFKHDRIKTTEAKAKELRRWADHIVTLAKRGDLHARRKAMSIVREKDVVHKLFEQASDRFGSISGGYTRIVKIGKRPGDAAAMTLVELISSDEFTPAKPMKPATQVAATAPDAEPEEAAAAPAVEQTETAETEASPASDAKEAEAAPEDKADANEADADSTVDQSAAAEDEKNETK